VVEFENLDDIEAWLKTRSRDEIAIFAARVALRAVPALVGMVTDTRPATQERDAAILRIFHALALAWFVAQHPAQGADGAIADATDAVLSAAAVIADSAASTVAYTAADAAFTAHANLAEVVGAAVKVVTGATNAGAGHGNSFVASAIEVRAPAEADANALASDEATAIELAHQPLWPNGDTPVWATNDWGVTKTALLVAGEDWEVWTRWYEARLAGEGSINEQLELARVTQITDEEWAARPEIGRAHV